MNCSIPGCSRPSRALTKSVPCDLHRQRIRSTGSSEPTTIAQRRTGNPALIRAAAMDRTDGPCLEWVGASTSAGYGYGPVVSPEPSRVVTRQVWTLANGPIPPLMLVCHRCDNPPCYRLAHLFLGTRLDNAADMVAKGRSSRQTNEKSGQARLTDAQVAEIRDWHRMGRSCLWIAGVYGVHPAHVSRITRGLRRPIGGDAA